MNALVCLADYSKNVELRVFPFLTLSCTVDTEMLTGLSIEDCGHGRRVNLLSEQIKVLLCDIYSSAAKEK